MNKTFKKLLLVGILMVCGSFAFAGDGNGSDGSTRTFELRKHEIAVGGSLLPGHIFHEIGLDDGPEPVRNDNAWWLSYTYNFTRLFALQFSLTYDGFTSEDFDWQTGELLRRYHEFYITPMVTARFSWLNRPLVRLYSSAGVGLAIDSEGWWKTRNNKDVLRRCRFGWEATPIGISIGKKLYGYAELGVGTVYNIGCLGIGYRF